MSVFVSGACQGERCFCGEPAEHKVEETIFFDDPLPKRHPLTSYICDEHFRQIMGPAADRGRRRAAALLQLPRYQPRARRSSLSAAMTSFKLAFHAVTGRRIVEVWEGEEFIAGIYPADRGVKVVSKHPMEVAKDDSPPAAVRLQFGRVPP